ncbi:MAG TPA: ABC transporter substrate-binding protein [Hyphomicrobiales bacterium]|nr:ABC transporter substrate-binding protein [Hyphomicrobiales bacterium]
MRHLKLLLPVLGLALVAGGVAHAQAPVPIRAGWIVPVANIGSILFAKPGIAQNDGKTYRLEMVHFQGTTPQINALATGDLDIGLLGFTSLPLAVQNAHLDDLKVIIDEAQDGGKGFASNPYFVLKSGGIKSVAGLKGKVLATNAYGSAVDLSMRIELLKNHIDPKTDVNVVEAAFPTMKTMLLSGKANLVPAVLPFNEDPELASKGNVLFTQADGMGGPSELAIWVARKSFLDKHHDAVVDFLADYLRALRFYLDPKNHDEAVQIASKFSKLPPKVFQSWLFTSRDYYRPADGVPHAEVLQHNIDTLVKYGFLKGKIDASNHVDASLIEAAAKRLK